MDIEILLFGILVIVSVYLANKHKTAGTDPCIEQEQQPLKGIGGWLIIFISSFFIRALLLIYNISTNYKVIIELSNQFPFMLMLYSTGKLISIAICFYGFFVAYSLIKIQHDAHLKAIRYIVLITIERFILFVSPFFYGLPDSLTRELLLESLPGTIGVLLFCIIWYLYFVKSRRVKNTFT